MKKFISVMMIAVVLMSAMSICAFADISTTGNTSKDVYAKYVAGGQVDAYKVAISWGSLNFTYSASGEEWNTESHTWVAKGTASWSVSNANDDVITITNHSSKAVTATFVFTPVTSTGVTGGTFTGATDNRLTVPAANIGSASQASVTFAPVGTLNSTATASTKIGQITITID